MDVAGFLCSFGYASNSDLKKKKAIYADALKATHEGRSSSAEELTPDLLTNSVPRGIAAYRFGRTEEDSFYTALLAAAFLDDHAAFLPEMAFFNRVVLQLTYQVRFQLDGIRPEAAIFVGSSRAFCASMLHANNIFGIRVPLLYRDADAAIDWETEWAKYPHLELNRLLLRQGGANELNAYLAEDNRSKIGSFLIDLDYLPTTIVLAEIFSDVCNRVDHRTIYAIVGNSEHVLGAALEFERYYPEAVVYCRTYLERRGNSDVPRAMLAVWNVDELPGIELRNHTPHLCTLVTFSDVLSSATDIKHSEYKAWETVSVKKPLCIEGAAPLLPEIRNAISGQRSLYHGVSFIADGAMFVEGGNYLFMSKDGNVLIDSGDGGQSPLYVQSELSQDNILQSVLRTTAVQRVKGTAIALAFQPTLHQFFSHFLIQCFPRLLIIEELGLKDVKVVVAEDLYPKQIEMLIQFGISPDNIVFLSRESILYADMLIVPYPWDLMFSEFTTRAFRQLMEKMNIRVPVTEKRLLISREFRKTWRNQLNSDQVQAILQKDLSFEVVRPEKLSLREEIELFSSSRVIAGAEGAGLYGACYSGPGRAVVSVSDGDYAMPILGSLAEYTGFDVSYYFGVSMRAEGDMSRRPGRLHCDYLVDPAKIVNLVEFTLDGLSSMK